jgi:hypothetical protein
MGHYSTCDAIVPPILFYGAIPYATVSMDIWVRTASEGSEKEVTVALSSTKARRLCMGRSRENLRLGLGAVEETGRKASPMFTARVRRRWGDLTHGFTHS